MLAARCRLLCRYIFVHGYAAPCHCCYMYTCMYMYTQPSLSVACHVDIQMYL